MKPDDLNRLEQIDALLDGNLPPDADETVNFYADLAQTRPQADPAFQQALEARLLAQRRTLKMQTRAHHQHLPLVYPQRKSIFSRLPLTLVAAALTVILVGGALLWFGQNQSNGNFAAQIIATATQNQANQAATQAVDARQQANLAATQEAQAQQQSNLAATQMGQATFTMTPTHTATLFEPTVVAPVFTATPAPLAVPLPVNAPQLVVLLQDVARGTVLTPDMVGMIVWATENPPTNAVVDLNFAIGAAVKQDIRAGSVLRSDQLIPNAGTVQIVPSGLVQYALGDDQIAITLPLQAGMASFLRPGDSIIVQAALPSGKVNHDLMLECRAALMGLADHPANALPSASDCKNLSEWYPLATGTVLNVGLLEISTSPGNVLASDSITLQVNSQQAAALIWAVEAELPLEIDLLIEADQ